MGGCNAKVHNRSCGWFEPETWSEQVLSDLSDHARPDPVCELLGMSTNIPADICFSFSGLMKRGGETGPHQDDCGIAFYEGSCCRAFHDPSASIQREIARLAPYVVTATAFGLGSGLLESCTSLTVVRYLGQGSVAFTWERTDSAVDGSHSHSLAVAWSQALDEAWALTARAGQLDAAGVTVRLSAASRAATPGGAAQAAVWNDLAEVANAARNALISRISSLK